MLVAIENKRILDCFETETESEILQRYPGCTVVTPEVVFPVRAMFELARVYEGRVVPKPTARISLSSQTLQANGADELEIKVAIVHYQPGELYDIIELAIKDAVFEVDLVENQGSIFLSTHVVGLHIIKMKTKGIVFREMGFTAQ